MQDILELGPDELGRGAQRIAILPQHALVLLNRRLLLLALIHRQPAPLQHAQYIRRGLDLPRMRTTRLVDEGHVAALGAQQRLRAHRRAHLGEQGQLRGVVQHERGQCGGEGGAVEQAELFLGQQREGREAVGGEGGRAGDDLARAEDAGAVEDADGGVADDRARDVRQRGEV